MNATTKINQFEKTLALTPALFPKRGSILATRNNQSTSAELAQPLDSILPLDGGEGRGEGEHSVPATQSKSKRSLKNELWFFAGLILFLNLPLLNGAWASAFAFH